MKHALALVLVTVFAHQAHAELCKHAEVVQARAAADKAANKNDFAGAVTVLKGLVKKCELEPNSEDFNRPATTPTLDFFWVESDLAYDLYKSGDFLGCRRLVSPLLTPHPPYGLSNFTLADEKVGKAIAYNGNLCDQAWAKRFAGFGTKTCPGSGDGSVSVSAKLVPKGASGDCLELEPATTSFNADDQQGEPDATKVCPGLSFRKGKGARKRLQIDGGPFTDTTVCCNLTTISVGQEQGKTLIRALGGGRICGGGTGVIWSDTLYEWNGDKLVPSEDNSIEEH